MVSTVDFADFVSVVVTWYAENVMKVSPTQHNRVTTLTLVTPNTMFDWYQEFQAVFQFTKRPQWYSTMTTSLFMLIWCSIGK